MKKLLTIALIVVALAVLINDAAAYMEARRTLVEATREAATAAAAQSRSGRDVAGRAAVDRALKRNVEVFLYNQDDTRVEVWARIPIEGTLVYAPALAFVTGASIDTTPVLEHYESERIR